MSAFNLKQRNVMAVWCLTLTAIVMAWAVPMAAQNYTLNVQPSTATLLPGQSTAFVVSMTPLNGFTSQVVLATAPLPSGVTATFSPNPVTLPGSSLLTLYATTNATLGQFTLDVTGVGGGITNATSSSVTVNFGLLPLCAGTFQGQVTDVQSGLPVPGASVVVGSYYYGVADTNGFYSITNLPLGSPDNKPVQYSVSANQSDYWLVASALGYAVCDATNTINLQMLKKQQGSISGQVLSDGSGVSNAPVTVSYYGTYYFTTNTDAHGNFSFANLPLAAGNLPVYYGVQVSADGYWTGATNTVVAANSNSVVTVDILAICHGSAQGRVVFGDTGLPDTNASVNVASAGYSYYFTTDSNGYYIATNLSLYNLNTAGYVTVSAGHAGYLYSSTNAWLSTCGQNLQMPTLQIAPQPVIITHYGQATGLVYDTETGLPITNAFVQETTAGYNSTSAYTDTNGVYVLTNVWVGTGATTNNFATISASANGYFYSSSNLTVFADEVVTQNLAQLKVQYGYTEGFVRDSVTLQPIPGAYVTVPGYPHTDSNGFYVSSLIQMGNGNTPVFANFEVTENGYWPIYTNYTVNPSSTNVTDVNLIKICTGATVVGNVVNALTQQPITNATVSAYNYENSQQAFTDTNGNFILTNLVVGNNNSPIQTTLTASAPGFNSQQKTITIFCNATIFSQFGQTETVFGNINGFVTNVITGLPLTNVFVGTGFGGAAYTDTNGYYSFTQVPLGANGASISWTVTATPNGYPSQTASVLVTSNSPSRQDFGFGQPPTALVVTATGTPSPVTVGSNLLYLVTLTNSVAEAQQVVLADTLPASVTYVSSFLTNSPGTAFSTPVYSNNVVTITNSDFASNSVVTLGIVVIPTTAGTLTNLATVTSTTPDIDPTGTNHSASVLTPAIAPVTALADVAVLVTESTNYVMLGNNITYTLLVTNGGPNQASSVTLDDLFPAGSTYVGSTVSQGTGTPGTNSEHWNLGAIANAGTATATLTLTPSATGLLTNTAFATVQPDVAGTTDPNLLNNTNTVEALVLALVVTNPPLTNVAVQALGGVTFNPQTGLYQQSVLFTNLTGSILTAVRVSVPGLPNYVTLYNATGTSNGAPYVEYDQSIGTNGGVVFLLEYYDKTRQDFASTNFLATVVSAATNPAPTGTTLQLDRVAFVSEGQLTIEFATTPGHTYVVQYSDNLDTPNWINSWPPITAVANKTQWIDAGPPKTATAPNLSGQRYYRVIQTN